MSTKLWSVLLLGSLGAVFASGCASSSTRTGTVPDSAWSAAYDSPRTAQPTTRSRTSRSPSPTAQAPASNDPLTREQVLQLANGRDPQDAIAEIDRHPLAFPLDGSNVAWFEDRLVAPEVADYLKKRAQVDWAQVREPQQAPAPTVLPAPAPQNDQWADAPQEQAAPSVVVEDSPPSTIVYEESSPTIIVGSSWYDGTYWRPWRPWYGRGYVSAGVTYSGGYGGVYYSRGYGNYNNNYYNGGANYYNGGARNTANYGRYPYNQGSFVYAQPRGFVPPRAISRPASPQARGGGGSRGGGHR